MDVLPARHRLRHWLALSGCLLWLCGIELIPALHVGFHDLWGEHTHRGAGHGRRYELGTSKLQRRPHTNQHRHGGSADHHHGTRDGSHGAEQHSHGPVQPVDPVPRPVDDSPTPSDPDHGADALAHFGVGILAPAPVLPVPEATLLGPAPAARPAATRPAIRSGAPPRARGPPLA